MTKVTILPIPTDEGVPSYLALSGDKQSFGRTTGEALDALTVHLGAEQTSTMVILPKMQPDEYFSADEQENLLDLMAQWRVARDMGTSLSQTKQSELESLVEAELLASAERTKKHPR